jgi:hypothetical protein
MKPMLNRGSALLAALIVIGVVALITAATLQLAGMSRAQAVKDTKWLTQTACADAARQYLLGRLRFYNIGPETIQLDRTIQLESGTAHIRTGHIGNTASIRSITAMSRGVGGSQRFVRNMSNVIGNIGLGGTSYGAVVTCTDPVAGEMELEFIFRFGL